MNIICAVRDYNLKNKFENVLRYFERFLLDNVGPFSVYRLRYRINNFIESYHAALLKTHGSTSAIIYISW